MNLGSDLILNRLEIECEPTIAKEPDIIRGLAVILTLKELVIVSVRFEEDVPSGDKEEPLSFPILSNEKSTGTLSPRPGLGADRETERSGKRLADFNGGARREIKREEPGTI
jgi:hypothetical protein